MKEEKVGIEGIKEALEKEDEKVLLDHYMVWGVVESNENSETLSLLEAENIAKVIRGAKRKNTGIEISIKIRTESTECLKKIVDAAKDNGQVVSMEMGAYSDLLPNEVELMAEFVESKSAVGDGKRKYTGAGERKVAELVQDYKEGSVENLCNKLSLSAKEEQGRKAVYINEKTIGKETLDDKDVQDIVNAINNCKGSISIVIDFKVLNDNQLKAIAEAASKKDNIASINLIGDVNDQTVEVMTKFAMTKYKKPNGTETFKEYAGNRSGDVNNMKELHTNMNSLLFPSKYKADLFTKTIDGKNAFDLLLARDDISKGDKKKVLSNILKTHPETKEASDEALKRQATTKGKGFIGRIIERFTQSKGTSKVVASSSQSITGADKKSEVGKQDGKVSQEEVEKVMKLAQNEKKKIAKAMGKEDVTELDGKVKQGHSVAIGSVEIAKKDTLSRNNSQLNHRQRPSSSVQTR